MKTELKQNEKVVITLRKHWVTLIAPVFWTLILMLIVVIGSMKTEYGMYFLMGGGLAILWFIYKIIDWVNNMWIVTNLRVIDEHGVFSINSKESPLDKINNVSYRQPLIGRILGFGNVQIQTAAEMGATIHRMVEKPKLLKDTITNYQDEYRHGQMREQAQSFANSAGGRQANTNAGLYDELTKLFTLMEQGIITEAEFKQRKAKILDS